jgi:peptidoglycan hydrolase CwlO-like protein
MTRSRTCLRTALAVVLAFAVSVTAVPVGADRHSAVDRRRQRERVRQQQALVASKIDTLRASDRQVHAALRAINANVSATQAELNSAQHAFDQATHDVAVAQQGVEDATASILELQSALAGLAVDSYVNPFGDTALAVLDTTSMSEAATKRALLGVVHRRNSDVADEIARTREDLTVRREEAENAAARADASRQLITGKLHELEAARTQQLEFEDRVQDRLDAALAEAASLQSQDATLAAAITRDQAALAAQLRTRSGARGQALPAIGNVNVVRVRGISVNASIADNLAALLAAADADGIRLGGAGYRNSSGQIAARRANCGSSQYAVYAMPASQCRPPTARPGASMHERGLAIDFTYGGGVIGSRSSPAYKWLAANASRYGFYNLPSEPWHWSTNGN